MYLRTGHTSLRQITAAELGNLELGVIVYIKKIGTGRYCVCAANGEIMLIGTDPGCLAVASYEANLFPVWVH